MRAGEGTRPYVLNVNGNSCLSPSVTIDIDIQMLIEGTRPYVLNVNGNSCLSPSVTIDIDIQMLIPHLNTL